MESPKDFYTNISGKVRNTKLPKSKSLWPLYEVISNSIHAIEEKGNITNGMITVNIIRNGDTHTLVETAEVEAYPIKSFIIEDNGIGFNDDNYKSFLTAESDYKIEKGAKGIGRFVCLVAFQSLECDSTYLDKDGKRFNRSFELKPTGKGIFNYNFKETTNGKLGTKIILNHFKSEYQDNSPKTLRDLGEKIIEHFLVSFVLEKCPYIKLIDSNNKELLLQNLYGNSIKSSIKKRDYRVGKYNFTLHLLRIYETNNIHKLHYCANHREVMDESLTKFIPDLGKQIKDGGGDFSYQCYITSSYLDEHVDNERTNFNFPTGEEEQLEISEDTSDISLAQIRNATILELENMLDAYLAKTRELKFNSYKNHIIDVAPQFKPIIKYKPEAIKRMQPGLTGNRLNIELFKIQNDLELEVKRLGDSVLNKRDIKSVDEYIATYNNYLEKFNDIGKSNLTKYIVHRKAVIELLDLFLGTDENGDFKTEDTIHQIFFPIKSESDEISYEQQNLWLIDERLAYHYYLSSDKSFKDISIINTEENKDRPDLLIFNDSFAFVNDDAPHNSFVIVEFKRPERKDYSTKTDKKNPVDQVISYIRTIRENKAIDRRGKLIQVDENKTPFYAYIICDFNQNLVQLLDEKNYKRTPDSQGYFYFHDKFNAYVEVISYQKLLKDAKIRNRVLFEKLGLPY